MLHRPSRMGQASLFHRPSRRMAAAAAPCDRAWCGARLAVVPFPGIETVRHFYRGIRRQASITEKVQKRENELAFFHQGIRP